MSGIDDLVSIHQLSIPGSHESCSMFGAVSKCQNLGLIWQLARGVRFLDVRCKYVSDDDPNLFFPVHHGPDYQDTDFLTVQKECTEFLNSYSDETILINVQPSHTGGTTFETKFNELRDQNLWKFPTAIPTLEHHRGKIILIRPCEVDSTGKVTDGWPGTGLEWNGFSIPRESFNAVFETQNYWYGAADSRGLTGTVKGEKVEQYLKDAAEGIRGPDKIYLNFLSRADSNIGDAASDMNARVATYFSGRFLGPAQRRFGVLPMDFVGNTGFGSGCLEDLIIRRNPFKTGTSLPISVQNHRHRVSNSN